MIYVIKTLRISEEVHGEVLKIQGAIQADEGEYISMDRTMGELVDCYKKNCKGRKK